MLCDHVRNTNEMSTNKKKIITKKTISLISYVGLGLSHTSTQTEVNLSAFYYVELQFFLKSHRAAVHFGERKKMFHKQKIIKNYLGRVYVCVVLTLALL